MEERDFAARSGAGYSPRGGGPVGGSVPYGYAAEFDVDLPSLRAPETPPEAGEGQELPPFAQAPLPGPVAADPGLWPGVSGVPYGALPQTGASLGGGSMAGVSEPAWRDPAAVPGMGAGWPYGGSAIRQEQQPVTVAKDELLEPLRKSLSPAGAFGMALLAHLSLAGLVMAAVWAFPAETGELLRGLGKRMNLTFAGPVPPSVWPVNRESGLDRLTILELEDRALYRGERSALEQLLRHARELDSSDGLFDAVQASLIRVRQSYQLSQGDVPVPLDPREILPGTESERDLTEAAIVDVLRNRRQSAAKRQRAAYLLANERQSAAAQNALFHAIQDDPNLTVMRQAFQSFQQLTGYPGRDFFDTDAIDRWWARNAASFMGQNTKK